MESEQVEVRECDRCGAAVAADARFCERCGAHVASTAARPCQACGAVLGPAARYCTQCGAWAGMKPKPLASGAGAAWGAPLRDGWARLRTGAAAVDWARVGRVTLPAAALLLVALLGYALGRRGSRPAPVGERPAGERVVTAARGWRAEEPPPRRFRDFRISASSWEEAHPPALAADGDPYTFWHAWKSEKFPEGEWITLTFPETRRIARIGLFPERAGAGARAEGRIKSLLVKAPDAPTQKLFFDDRPAMQYRDLKPPVETRQLILRIGTVLPGRETRHIVIPEIQAWGYPAPEHVTLRQKVEQENPPAGG
jgi:ribosomal protein L40E